MEDEQRIWNCLDEVFRDAGFTLWTHDPYNLFRSPGQTYPSSSGFGYVLSNRKYPDQIRSVGMIREFQVLVC